MADLLGKALKLHTYKRRNGLIINENLHLTVIIIIANTYILEAFCISSHWERQRRFHYEPQHCVNVCKIDKKLMSSHLYADIIINMHIAYSIHSANAITCLISIISNLHRIIIWETLEYQQPTSFNSMAVHRLYGGFIIMWNNNEISRWKIEMQWCDFFECLWPNLSNLFRCWLNRCA